MKSMIFHELDGNNVDIYQISYSLTLDISDFLFFSRLSINILSVRIEFVNAA